MQKCISSYRKTSFITVVLFLLFALMLVSCSSGNGNADSSKAIIKTPNSTNVAHEAANIEANAMTALPQVSLGAQACPAAVGTTAYWDPIVGTQSGVSSVGRVTCANLIGNATLQALVLVGYQGTGNIVDVYVYNKITDPHPQQIFKLQNLYKGDAKISNYNTILTAEVDQNSSVNKNAGGNNALQPDLFREFKWSVGVGTFVAVAFPGIFPVLTRYQAETDQQQVNQGHQPWQISASMTGQALVATLLKWSPDSPATIIQGGGEQDDSASVDVKSTNPGGGTVHVAMSRLYGKIGNIWIATRVTSDGLSLTSPAELSRLVSPVNVAGTSQATGGKAGIIHIFDHTQADIGHVDVKPSQSNGSVTYSAAVSYNTTFKTGTQEGMVALYLPSKADGSIAEAVIMKVLLG